MEPFNRAMARRLFEEVVVQVQRRVAQETVTTRRQERVQKLTEGAYHVESSKVLDEVFSDVGERVERA